MCASRCRLPCWSNGGAGGRTWRKTCSAVDVDPLDDALAKMAGEALAAVPRATAVDAVVMASAAKRGDSVYTADYEDLTRLQAHFRGVRVLAV